MRASPCFAILLAIIMGLALTHETSANGTGLITWSKTSIQDLVLDTHTKLEYAETRPGFVPSRKSVEVLKNGDYSSRYNGAEGCRAAGVLSPVANRALWNTVSAMTRPKGVVPVNLTAIKTSRPKYEIPDYGNPTQTLRLEQSDSAAVVLISLESSAARSVIRRLRELLPACAVT